MIPTGLKQNQRASLKRRRREVGQCLASFGLQRGPRLFSRAAEAATREESPILRLREALPHLGPVFVNFGLYLATRADLLPARYCLQLATLSDQVPSESKAFIRELMKRELGASLEEIFCAFEDKPFASRLLFQSHRATLKDGQPVTVMITRPNVEEYLEGEFQMLSLLPTALPLGACRALMLDGAIANFQRVFRPDSIRGVQKMADLELEAAQFEMLRPALVHNDFCSAHILTIERAPGPTLSEMITLWRGQSARVEQTPGGSGSDPADLAWASCVVWLRQALLGELFPVEPFPENITVPGVHQIAFTGGAFATLPAESKANLFNYLTSFAAGDLERACACLLKELDADGRLSDEAEFRQRFRHVVPFRDGGWSQREGNNSLAEHLFVHWRLANEFNLKPQPHLIPFYRGLFVITATARRVAPEYDPLPEALEELRVIAGVTQLRDMLSLPRLGESSERHIALMMELPRRFDEALSLLSEGTAHLDLQVAQTASYRRQKNASSIVAALLSILAAIVLLTHHLAVSMGSRAWFERIGAIAFAAFGCLLLWTSRAN